MNFYSMQPAFSKNEFAVTPVFDFKFYDLFKGNLENNTTKFVQTTGGNLHDIIHGGVAGLFLISEKVVSKLIEYKISGYKTFRSEVLDKSGNPISGYYGFSVTGRCGTIQDEKSEIITKMNKNNTASIKFKKGLYFDVASWDGSEIFSPDKTMMTFVVPKVKDILQEFSNLKFENIMEIERLVF